MTAAFPASDVQDYPVQDYLPDPPRTAPVAPPAESRGGRLAFLRDPLSLFLIGVITLALVVAGLIGTEFYARHLANEKVVKATECETEDSATVSFGIAPPFLWQHINGHYTNISIHTAGNRIKDAKQMTADLTISDVRIQDTGDSGGSIGALDATLTWPSDGIKETIHDMVPLLGRNVDEVTTHPEDGTVELVGGLAGVVVRPTVQNHALSLELVKITGLASIFGGLVKEGIQPQLDKFTERLTAKYPMGIQADSLEVTDTGVVARFSTRNAAIPAHSDNPCFADL